MTLRSVTLVAVGFITVLLLLVLADYLTNGGSWKTGSGASEQSTTVSGPVPDVSKTAEKAGLIGKETSEPSVLQIVLESKTDLRTVVLLRGEDRAAFLAWTESADSEEIFGKLKELVHGSFSQSMQDLIDETQHEQGKRTRDVVSFLDPAIHPERLLFARSGERIYEFHIAPGNERAIDDLLDALTD